MSPVRVTKNHPNISGEFDWVACDRKGLMGIVSTTIGPLSRCLRPGWCLARPKLAREPVDENDAGELPFGLEAEGEL